jgi:hypothetical protein
MNFNLAHVKSSYELHLAIILQMAHMTFLQRNVNIGEYNGTVAVKLECKCKMIYLMMA